MPAGAFLASGFVHAIASREAFPGLVAEVVAGLASAAPGTCAPVKALLHQWHEHPSEQGLARELEVFAGHWKPAQVALTLRGFLDRREQT